MEPSPSILVILILLSALFSGLEIAFFSLSDSTVEALVEKNIKNAKRVKALKKRQDTLLITILIGNNVVNIAASAMATVMATNYFGSNGAGIAVGIMTVVILIFGEITPKSLATRYGEEIALFLAPVIQFLQIILFPFVWFFTKINHVITQSFTATKTVSEEEEIHALTRMGVKEGTIEKHEEKFIQNILSFDETTVEQIMTPRVDMIALDGNQTFKEVFEILQKERYSRYPVYKDTIDNIIGMIYVKDLLFEDQDIDDLKIEKLAKPPLFVPHTNFIDDLFREMKTKRIHIAVVYDEHGGTDGLITLEDIIEEVLGEINDEKDVKEVLITKKSHNTWVAAGKIELKELVDHINIDFEDENMILRAFITEKLEHMPKVGEIYHDDEYSMEVISAANKLVEFVKIVKKDENIK